MSTGNDFYNNAIPALLFPAPGTNRFAERIFLLTVEVKKYEG